MNDVLAECGERRLQLRERRVVGADHDVEAALLRFDRRARERRVDEAHVLLGEHLAHPRRRRGLARRRVDDDQPLWRSAGNAVGTEDDLLDLRSAGHAENHDVGVARELRIARRLAGAGRQQILRRFAIAMHAQREREAFRQEILRDAVAHEPNADEADTQFFHFECSYWTVTGSSATIFARRRSWSVIRRPLTARTTMPVMRYP